MYQHVPECTIMYQAGTIALVGVWTLIARHSAVGALFAEISTLEYHVRLIKSSYEVQEPLHVCCFYNLWIF